jgi:hypothetical protein
VNRTLRYWWCAGFFIAWNLYCFWWFYRRGTFGQFADDLQGMYEGLTLALWPSQILLASLKGQSPRLAVVLIAASLVLNGFIYVGIGYVLAKVFGRAAAPPLA